MKRSLMYTCLLWACAASCTHKSATNLCDPTYTTGMKPVVTQHCALAGCHGAGSTIADFTDYDVLKTKADAGLVYNYVFVLKIMPPASADTLSAEDKFKIKCWLDNGAQK